MNDYLQKRVKELGTWTLSGVSTIAWDPGFPAMILRLVFVYTTANSVAANIITAQRRPIAGVAANQVVLGVFPTTAVAPQGSVDHLEVGFPVASVTTPGVTSLGGGPSSIAFSAQNPWTINPGQDFALVSAAGGTAGVVDAYVEYVHYPWGNAGQGAGAINQLKQTA
jgi:hypothetical protein